MPLIALEGMRFYAYHGYYSEENLLGGEYMVDVYVESSLHEGQKSDELEGTVNYEEIYEICSNEMKINSKLIENVGERILCELSSKIKGISSIKVRISKFNPPLGGQVKRSFVEIEKKF